MKYKGGISIIIPIYNEELLLKKEVVSLVHKLGTSLTYEIILVENGSNDSSYSIAMDLSGMYSTIRVIKQRIPSYGSAVKKGLESAIYDTVIQFDLDLIDLSFFKKAIILLQKADVVVGSKTLAPFSDKRSFVRMSITRSINYVLRTYLGYKGTDTHGIKAYRKQSIFPLLKQIVNTNLFFDTEILLIAQKNNLRIRELPVSVNKLRPTRFTMHIVIFQTVIEFISLLRRKKSYMSTHDPIVTVDDYGLNPKVNRAINSLISRRKIATVSILPNHEKPLLNFKGIAACHINIIEGKSTLSPAHIPSLVNRSGRFHPFIVLYLKLLLNQVSFTELAREIDAQIMSVSKHNTITELNSHQHTHALYPLDVIVDALSKKHDISRVRTYGKTLHFSPRGLIFKLFFIGLVGIEHLIFGKILSQSPAWKKDGLPISFMSWETSISPASFLYELVCHPGTPYDKNTVYTSILK